MRRLLLIAILGAVILVDQSTKVIVMRSLQTPLSYLGGHLVFLRAGNTGAFLSLGAALPKEWRAIIFSGVVAVGLCIATYVLFAGKMQSRADEIALAFIVAGGFGNLIDRIRFQGEVTDFIYLQAGPLHTGVFNVADMAITGGVVWLLVSWGFAAKKKEE